MTRIPVRCLARLLLLETGPEGAGRAAVHPAILGPEPVLLDVAGSAMLRVARAVTVMVSPVPS